MARWSSVPPDPLPRPHVSQRRPFRPRRAPSSLRDGPRLQQIIQSPLGTERTQPCLVHFIRMVGSKPRMEDQTMHSTKRAVGKIWIIGTLVLGGLLLAASAEANDRSRGARINDHLDILAFVAAMSGDHYLAFALDRRGDRIEHRYARHDQREASHWRGRHRSHHRHFAACGHGDLRHRLNHSDRFDRRSPHKRNHRRHQRRRH